METPVASPPAADPTMEESDRPKYITLLEDGDMYIEVEPRGAPCIRYLVGSQILCSASSVFKSWYGPNSQSISRQRLDGQLPDDQKTHDGKPVYDFDDEAEMLGKVLRVMHHVSKDIPREVSFAEMVELAVIVDKYQLQGALRIWADEWRRALRVGPPRFGTPTLSFDKPGYENWLFVAWVFDYADDFKTLSGYLIKRAALKEEELEFTGGMIMRRFCEQVPESVIERLRLERHLRVKKIREAFTSVHSLYTTPPTSQSYLCKRTISKQLCDQIQVGHLVLTTNALGLDKDAFWQSSLEEIQKNINAVEPTAYPGVYVEYKDVPVAAPQPKPSESLLGRAPARPANATFSGFGATRASGSLGNTPVASFSFGGASVQPAQPTAQSPFGNFANTQPSFGAQPAYHAPIAATTATPSPSTNTIGATTPQPVFGTPTPLRPIAAFGRASTPAPAPPVVTVPEGKVCTSCEGTQRHLDDCKANNHAKCSWLPELRGVVEVCCGSVAGVEMGSFGSKKKVVVG